MPDIRIDLKRIFACASLIPMLGEASAAPLGVGEDARVYYVAGLFLVSSALAFIYYKSKTKAPIEVVALAYDRDKHKIELTVRNRKQRQYCMKSVLRLVHSPEQYAQQPVSDGSIPLAAARISSTDRRLYQLLCEDDEAIVINPSETKTISYDIIAPKDHVAINPDQNVEVSISYGEDKTHLKPLYDAPTPESDAAAPYDVGQQIQAPTQADSALSGDNAFQLKVGDDYVVAEVFLLEDLLEAVRKTPSENIACHMKEQNDFAVWISSVIKDVELAAKLNTITFTTPDDTKKRIIDAIDARIGSLKHPYLRKVPEDKSFVLKLSHGEAIAEVFMLEDLLEAVKKAPDDAIKFHTQNGNDFSVWISDAVGDKKLAENIKQIDYGSSEARIRLQEKLEARVQELKKTA